MLNSSMKTCRKITSILEGGTTKSTNVPDADLISTVGRTETDTHATTCKDLASKATPKKAISADTGEQQPRRPSLQILSMPYHGSCSSEEILTPDSAKALSDASPVTTAMQGIRFDLPSVDEEVSPSSADLGNSVAAMRLSRGQRKATPYHFVSKGGYFSSDDELDEKRTHTIEDK
ncbi:hypothetical protein EMMF5_006142 [Cystobasidiomycetes sp. EMM_F5]